MSKNNGRRDDWRRTRVGRLGLDGDTLMGPDWFKRQVDLAIEETDLHPEETRRNMSDVAARDWLLRIAGAACITLAGLTAAACIIGAIMARGE